MNVDCKFTITGKIIAFDRIDNALNSMRTQVEKLLKDWSIQIEVNYTEQQGTGEVPQ